MRAPNDSYLLKGQFTVEQDASDSFKGSKKVEAESITVPLICLFFFCVIEHMLSPFMRLVLVRALIMVIYAPILARCLYSILPICKRTPGTPASLVKPIKVTNRSIP